MKNNFVAVFKSHPGVYETFIRVIEILSIVFCRLCTFADLFHYFRGMFSPLQLGVKYLQYLLTASNAKGHGVHSPFVFNFIKNILNDKTAYDAYSKIECVRKELLHDKRVLAIQDFGAGSTVIKTNNRRVAEIARSSLKPKKFSQLLYRVVQYYKPRNIVELGTSLGITTSYFANANPSATLYTFEGATEVASLARQTFTKAGASNIVLIEGNFDKTLPAQLNNLHTIDLAFVDGNHRREPTVRYFNQLLQKANEQSIFIFDDIHWSVEMELAWHEIKKHPSVTLTIDLFFIGIVFFRKEQKAKQHFTIRF